MNMVCKKIFRGYIYILIIVNLYVLTGCQDQNNKSNNVGSGPTIESITDLDSTKDESEVIKEAIKMSENIMEKIDEINAIDKNVVYINHESVLVAVKVKNASEFTENLRSEIGKCVNDTYKGAKTIAISDDEYVYESISRLMKSYKDDDPMGELLKDLNEIIKNLK